MSLNLNLSTKAAREELSLARQELQKLQTAISGFNVSRIESLNASLARLKIPTNTATQVQALSSALSSISTGNVDRLAAALRGVTPASIKDAATAVKQLNAALSSVRVPPALVQLGGAFAKVQSSAASATSSVRNFNASLQTVRAPTALVTATTQLKNFGAAAGTARGQIAGLGGSMSTVSSLAAGFGATLGAAGLAKFTTSSLSAADSMRSFRAAMETFGEDADKQLDVLRSLGDEFGVSLGTLVDSFRKFGGAALSAKVPMEQINSTFRGFTVAGRAMSLTTDQMGGVFKALTDIFSKGTVQAEELRQQLGDRIPGAFGIAQEAAGLFGKEFIDAMAAGELGSDIVIKMAEILENRFTKAAKNAADSFMGQMERLKTAYFVLQETFGQAFGEAFKDSIKALADAMASTDFQTFAKEAGAALGAVASAITTVVQWGVRLAATAPQLTAWGLTIGGVAATVAIAAGAIGLAFSGIGAAIATVVGGFAAAGAAAAVMVKAVTGAFALIAPAIMVVSPAVAAFAAGLTAIVGVAAYLSSSTKEAGDAVESFGGDTEKATDAARKIESALTGANANLNQTDTAASSASGSVDSLKQNMTSAGSATKTLEASMTGAASSATRLSSETEKYAGVLPGAATGAERLATAQGNVDAASSGVPGKLANAAAQANNLATQYARATREAEQLARAQARISGGSSGGTVRADSFAGGGLTNKGSSRKMSVPAAAFAGAPQFAAGGSVGNVGTRGIPAILHSNEAVVPLAGGGSIPVAFSGMGAAPQGDSGNNLALRKLIEIDQEQARTTAGVLTSGQLLARAYDLFEQMVDKLSEISRKMSSGGGGGGSVSFSGGGGSSGGIGGGVGGGIKPGSPPGGGGFSDIGGSGGSAGPVADVSDFQAQVSRLIDLSRQATRLGVQGNLEVSRFEVNGGYASGVIPVVERLNAEASMIGSEINEIRSYLQRYAGVTPPSGFDPLRRNPWRRQANVPQEVLDLLAPSQRDAFVSALSTVVPSFQYSNIWATVMGGGSSDRSILGFADGVRNTSEVMDQSIPVRDGRGGFLAVLHPNEAVIPLEKLSKRSSRISDGDIDDMMPYRDRGTSSGGSPTYNINVYAIDGKSVRDMAPQIAQEIDTAIGRSRRTIGTRSDRDDNLDRLRRRNV